MQRDNPKGSSAAEGLRFFRRIGAGVDVLPFLTEIAGNDAAWLVDESRQTKVAVQRHTQSIQLRVAAPRNDLALRENQENHASPISLLFAHAMDFMQLVADELQATLERAAIVRLAPLCSVDPHIDAGSYYFIRDRLHFVVQSDRGSILAAGDEKVRMWPGELWWFDNKQYHWATNESDSWRIHFIFDLLSPSLKNLAVNPLLSPGRAVPTRQPLTRKPTVETNSSVSSQRERLQVGIRQHALITSDECHIVSRSGRQCNWMFDMRRVLLEPRFLELAVNLFWDEFSDEYPFQVGGLETASIPLISGIQIESMRRAKPVNGFIVRKERKLSGTGTLIEGSLSEDKIIVVDDILNSADSISRVGAVLDACSRNIYSVFVLLDYRAQPGLEWRSRNTITVRSLFSLSDFDVELRERKQEAVKREIFRLKWTFRAPLGSFHYRIPKSSPIVDGMTIYFGTDDGTFWALDALSGERRWCFEVRTSGRKNLWSSPSLFEQSVLFGAYDGNVYRLDKSTGEVQWSFSEADWVGSSPAIAGDLGLVFIGLEFATPGKQGAIAALDIGTGEKVWERQTVRYTHASPIYDARNGIVVCGSNNDEIFALEAKTGFDRWRFQTRGDGRKGSVRHAGAIDYTRDQLLVGAADGYIYVIDLLSGCEIWHIRTDNEVYTIPLVHEDYAFVGSTDKYLYVIDLEKKRVHKKHSLQSKIYAPPRLLNGSVYSAACDGRIVKLSPSSGDILGIHQLPDAVTNALAYCNETGLYYALTYVGELYALSES